MGIRYLKLIFVFRSHIQLLPAVKFTSVATFGHKILQFIYCFSFGLWYPILGMAFLDLLFCTDALSALWAGASWTVHALATHSLHSLQ